jgi:arginyl-tRNA synthetase
MGDLGWPVFSLAKELGKNPAELAKEIAEKYPTSEITAQATGPY